MRFVRAQTMYVRVRNLKNRFMSPPEGLLSSGTINPLSKICAAHIWVKGDLETDTKSVCQKYHQEEDCLQCISTMSAPDDSFSVVQEACGRSGYLQRM